nr:MAG TPA: hypothetical protein [Bacteriophage sp.]
MKRRIEKRKDPRYLGVPNINFSLTKSSDKREGKYMNQRKTRGFDDSELWSLDCTICKFIAPRLKAFIKHSEGSCPGKFYDNPDEWAVVLNKMLYAFEHYDVNYYLNNDADKINEGLDLFHKYFNMLWD